MSNLEGQTFGQYEILDLIGKGGMATVYRARQSSIGRLVALKVLPAQFLHDDTFLKRFQREVQAIARMQHPHILPVHDYGEENGIPYIVMAYIDGGSLSQRINDEGSLPLDETIGLVEQIAGGLDYAHQQGVIHRDFKPSNVLIDKGKNAYLADFGIAKVSQATMQLTGSGIVGTPAYMAPEMFKNEPVTPTVDIYAMGVTLYQMLSGSAPYHGTTPVQLMYAHLNEPVPDILEVRDDLPSAVQGVIEKAMAKDPAARYQRGGAMAEDLRRAATGFVERAVPVEVEAAATSEIPPDTLPDRAPMPVTPPPTATPMLVSEPGEIPAVEAAQPPRVSWWQLNWRMVAAIAAAIVMYGLALVAILTALGV